MSKCEDCKNYEPKKKKYKCPECNCRVFVRFIDESPISRVACVNCGNIKSLELSEYYTNNDSVVLHGKPIHFTIFDA